MRLKQFLKHVLRLVKQNENYLLIFEKFIDTGRAGIESNPGSAIYTCPTCDLRIPRVHRSLWCHLERWVHQSCTSLRKSSEWFRKFYCRNFSYCKSNTIYFNLNQAHNKFPKLKPRQIQLNHPKDEQFKRFNQELPKHRYEQFALH